MKLHEYGRENDRTLLFFQSAAEYWRSFEDAARLLARHYHVFLVGADGHDPYDDPGDFISIEDTVEKVTAALLARGVTTLDVVYGMSMGGAMALRLLAERRIPVEKAIIDGGITPYPWPRPVCLLIAVKDFLVMKAATRSRRLVELAYPPERYTQAGHDAGKEYDDLMEFYSHYSDRTIWNVFWSTNNYSLPQPPAVIDTKLEYWYGEEERAARRGDITFVKRYFPQTKVRKIRGMAHGELVMIHPQRFYETAMRVLEGMDEDL